MRGVWFRPLHAEFLIRLQADKRFAHRELGFVVGDQPWILEITPHSSRLSAERVRRTYLRCGWAPVCATAAGASGRAASRQ